MRQETTFSPIETIGLNLQCYSEKFYVDIVGGGETNYDFGIVSKLDCELSASTSSDSGSAVKVNYNGRGSYTETLEYPAWSTADTAVTSIEG